MAGRKLAKPNNKWLNRFKKWHRWPSLIFGVFFICWAVSGIVLNHRDLFSPLDLNRSWMAEEYQYTNWNNAAIKGAVHLSEDSVLVYGNIGIWLTDAGYSRFHEFNRGFPEGVDNRKVFSLLESSNGHLYAGTLFGLYYYDQGKRAWRKVTSITQDEQVTALTERAHRIHILTRSELYLASDRPEDPQPVRVTLPPPAGYDDKIGLFKTLWVIHSGEIYGTAGKLIVDLMGLAVILLTITGIIHFIMPYVLRRKKKLKKSPVKASRLKRGALSWHKQVGIGLVLFLLVNTLTGMFLRPPLLIAIASSKVDKIPHSSLDTPNAWFDKLRDIMHDEELGGYLVATTEGIYFADEEFAQPLERMPAQPPVSVMGINVFGKLGRGHYLVGSFSGLYDWFPGRGLVIDRFTGLPPQHENTTGRPISEHMVSGLIRSANGQEFYLDYNQGAVGLNAGTDLPPMPQDVIERSPMSWWNFALEVHTARFFKFLFGDFYILFIPLFGIFSTILLLAGLGIWIKVFLRRRKSRKHCKELPGGEGMQTGGKAAAVNT